MNIGITVYPTYGGSGIVGSELGKELAARGHTVHFIASALPTRLTELNDRVRFHEVEMTLSHDQLLLVSPVRTVCVGLMTFNWLQCCFYLIRL